MTGKRRLSRLKVNFASGIINSATALVVQIVLTPFVLKTLGSETYGLWTTLSIVTVFGTLGNQGLADSLTRAVATYHKSKNSIVCDYLAATLFCGAVLSIAFAVTIYLSSGAFVSAINVDNSLRNQSIQLAQALSLYPVIIILDNIFASFIAGYGRLDLVNMTRFFSNIARLIITLSLLYYFKSIWVLYAGTISMYVLTFASLLLISKKVHNQPFRTTTKATLSKLGEIAKYSKDIFLARLIGLSFDPLLRVLIAKYIGLSEAGYFNISMRFVFAFQGIIRSGVSAYFPYASEKLASEPNSISSLRKRTAKLSRRVLLVMITAYVFQYWLGGFAVEFWLKDAYDAKIVQGFNILLIGYVFNTTTYPYVLSYLALGDSSRLLANNLTMALILGLLCFSLIATGKHTYDLFVWTYTIAIIANSVHAYFSYIRSCDNHLLSCNN